MNVYSDTFTTTCLLVWLDRSRQSHKSSIDLRHCTLTKTQELGYNHYGAHDDKRMQLGIWYFDYPDNGKSIQLVSSVWKVQMKIKGYRGDARTSFIVLTLYQTLERNNLVEDEKEIGCPHHKMGTKVSKDLLCHYRQATVAYRKPALWKHFCS